MTPFPKYQWIVKPSPSYTAMSSLGMFSPVMQRLLSNRGIVNEKEAGVYLNSAVPLFDPFILGDMDKAVPLILETIDQNTPIVVYGDYDVDGVTASAILVQVIRKLGGTVTGYIPNRFEEGYGVNMDAVKHLADEGIGLIITVDCGIRSVADVAYAKELGMKMIISDHHEPDVELPLAEAVICQKKNGDPYPEKNLAGVGLAFKIAEALLQTRPLVGVDVCDWLDFVAIGTVADIVSLTGENRSLVKGGLFRLQSSSRPCIRALAEVCDINLPEIKASHIGYSIGPRINAAGRLETAKLSFDLLMSEDITQARMIAQELNEQNKQRQSLTRTTQDVVMAKINALDEVPLIICDADSGFNMGVVGLAASKLTETFYRPSVVGAQGEDLIKASCRSIAGFSMIDALDACADLMERHGGHTMAAGLTIKNENWPLLCERLEQIAKESITPSDLLPSRTADMEIELDYLLRKDLVYQSIKRLEPNGMNNPEPVFIVHGLNVSSCRRIGSDQRHLKLVLKSNNGETVDAVAFGKGDWADEMPQKIDVLCTLDLNVWRGVESLQLMIIDIRSAQTEDICPSTK